MPNHFMSTKEKIIGLDMDGVIIDFSQLRVDLARSFGFALKREQTASELLTNFMPKEVVRELQQLTYHDPKIALTPPLMPGVADVLSKMQGRGVKYFLISRRKDPEIAANLLKRHRLWPDFFNENNAAFVDSIDGKNLKAKEFGITHYLDDEVKVLERLRDVQNRFLFDQFSVRPNFDFYTRLTSWDEVAEKFYVF